MSPPRIITLLGLPGAGKGTLAIGLQERLGLSSLSTGEIMRSLVGQGATGRRLSQVTRGELGPEGPVRTAVKQALAQTNPLILDGFPRTLSQVEFLEELRGDRPLTPLMLRCGEQVAAARVRSRNQSRNDDRPIAFARRLEVFNLETVPVIEHYASIGSLHELDASKPIHDVLSQAIALLDMTNSSCENECMGQS